MTEAVTSAPALSAVTSFGDRLSEAFADYGQLCVGIDPHSWLLSDWNLPDSAAGAESFGRTVVAAAAGQAGIVKPQVAFYERFGSAGFIALERVLADARAAGLLVIGDAKRGDLGTSVEAYAEAWLTPGSPLEVDALTVSGYMGVGSLETAITVAQRAGKGLFLLGATSNPEGAALQHAIVGEGAHAGASVARAILDDVAERNARADSGSLGSLGVVLGAITSVEPDVVVHAGAWTAVDACADPGARTRVWAPGRGARSSEQPLRRVCTRRYPE